MSLRPNSTSDDRVAEIRRKQAEMLDKLSKEQAKGHEAGD